MDSINWDLLQQMRQGFLDSEGHLPDYWHDERWLFTYEQTLAQRIGWKWQAVLEALRNKLEWLDQIPVVLDWGCGTGIASRTLLQETKHQFSQIVLHDRSALAMRFAAAQIKRDFPLQNTTNLKQGIPPHPYLLLVSHVLSELPADDLLILTRLAENAAAVFWVEPGRRLESRQLSLIHDSLLKTHSILGPCLHQKNCGINKPGREADWCHNFAAVPQDVFHSAFWRDFSRRMHIDLRSLPVSWLAAVKPEYFLRQQTHSSDALILGRPKAFKGYCRWLACTEDGLCEGEFPKRLSKEIYQKLADPEFSLVLPLAQLRPESEVF